MTARTSTYDPTSVSAGGFADELVRLEQQAELTFDVELAKLAEAGVRDGARVLDLGCGSGAFTRRLRAALPLSVVTGADIDPRMLARVAAPTVLIDQAADAAVPAVADGSVDVVVVRYVAQHLDTEGRARLWRRAFAALAPEGLLIVIDVDDADWGTVTPLAPGLSAVFRQIAASQSQRGGDRFVVRALAGELNAAGFGEVTPRIGVLSSDDRLMDDFAVHLGPARYLGQVVDGVVSIDDLAAIAGAWETVRRDPAARVELHVHVISTVRSPPTTKERAQS